MWSVTDYLLLQKQKCHLATFVSTLEHYVIENYCDVDNMPKGILCNKPIVVKGYTSFGVFQSQVLGFQAIFTTFLFKTLEGLLLKQLLLFPNETIVL